MRIEPGHSPDSAQQPEQTNRCKPSVIWKGALITLATGIAGALYLQHRNVYQSTLERVDTQSDLPGVIQRCGNGVNISDNTYRRLYQLIPDIMNQGADTDDIRWISQGNTKVFSLKDGPSDIVFKTATNYLINIHNPNVMMAYDWNCNNHKTCRNIALAEQVVTEDSLNLIDIPPTSLISYGVEDKMYSLLAQRKISENTNDSKQQELYRRLSSKMQETIRQLARFILRSHFADMTWRNAPISASYDLNSNAPPSVVLHDLDMMSEDETGLIDGPFKRHGLLRCTYPENFDIILAEASKPNAGYYRQEDLEKIIQWRRDEIAQEEALLKFHADKGIIDGREPIQVDLESLGLDPTNTEIVDGSPTTMVMVAGEIVKKINQQLSWASEKSSVPGRREILIRSDSKYNILGYRQQKPWVPEILKALVAKGYIFRWKDAGGHGYEIQA